MFAIRFAKSAQEELMDLRSFERTRVVEAIERELTHSPTATTRNKKLLRGEDAVWQLRVGDFRVFYDVQKRTVVIQAIRHKGRKTTGEIR